MSWVLLAEVCTSATFRACQFKGTYIPSTSQWVRDQVEQYERSGGTEANTLLETGIPVIIVTMLGAKSGNVRKIALMRVEHGGEYALVASKGGAPANPEWYANLLKNPTQVTVQDGPTPVDMTVRELSGDERQTWWDRSVVVYPSYADYQVKTDRLIPVLLASPVT